MIEKKFYKLEKNDIDILCKIREYCKSNTECETCIFDSKNEAHIGCKIWDWKIDLGNVTGLSAGQITNMVIKEMNKDTSK